ncbi:unnamed protein product [Rotaria socialis]
MSIIFLDTAIILLVVSLVTASVPDTHITVSGISSGGAMATQLHIGFSKDISGCGILAGPPFYCGGSGMTTALCMTGPALLISVTVLEQKIKYYRLLDKIDDPVNLKGDPVYVFSGIYDKVAYPGVVKLNEQLYSRLGATVKTNFNMPAHHGFPTENFGAACSTLNMANYINNCNFNLAYDMLNHLSGGNLTKPVNSKTPLVGQMLMFDQNAFMNFPLSLAVEENAKLSMSEWIKNTTTSPPCTKTPNVAGAIFSFSTASIPLTYTRYSYGFTASDSSSTVTFILTGDSGPGQHYWLIDDVSVNDTRNNTDLLTNGDFDDGTFNGWTQFCATDANCGNGLYGQLTTSPCRSAPKCYMDKCNNGRYYDYLLQSFQTVTGNYYILSFYIRAFANGGSHLAYVMLS